MKKFSIIIISILFIISLSACKRQEYSDGGSTEGSASFELGLYNDGYYPITIQNYNYAGEPVEMTFAKPPENTLAVYQSSIETMLALGLEDNIVAASGLDFDVKPEYTDAFSGVNYLTEFAPNKESAIMLEPDFIFSWKSLFGEKMLGDVSYWHESGVNTYIATNSVVPIQTLENEYTDILNIGKIFNVEEKAEKIVNDMKAQVEEISAFAAEIPAQKKVLVMESQENDIRVYGKDTLAGDMVAKLGAKIIYTEGNTIGNEELINQNPDIIFVVYFGSSEDIALADAAISKIADDPMFSSLTAVQNQTIYPIPLAEIFCSGIRTGDGIDTLAKGIYPEYVNNIH